MTKTLATREPDAFAQIKDLVYKEKARLEEVLPREIPADRFVRATLAVAFKNPLIAKCHPLSVLQSMLEAAALGLEPTGLIGGGWLVPFRNKEGVYMAQFIPSYHGLIALAVQDGSYETVEAHLVRANDRFRFVRGGNQTLEHESAYDDSEIIGAYAIARRASGAWQGEYMTIKDLEAIRERSKAKNAGPWVTDRPEMYRKTVVKRLHKYLGTCGPRVRRAIQIEDEAEGESIYDGLPPVRTRGDAIMDQLGKAKQRLFGGAELGAGEPPPEDAGGEDQGSPSESEGDSAPNDEDPIQKARRGLLAVAREAKIKVFRDKGHDGDMHTYLAVPGETLRAMDLYDGDAEHLNIALGALSLAEIEMLRKELAS